MGPPEKEESVVDVFRRVMAEERAEHAARGSRIWRDTTRPFAERFWSRVEKSEGCWEWQGPTHDGYGSLTRHGVSMGAHRAAWLETHGEIPDGLCVLHHCDNRRCVRPEHLFLGTRRDNAQDAQSKGRHSAGERHGGAKLTWERVRQIRETPGVPDWKWARSFGVAVSTIEDARRGRTWKAA